jgi:pyruvate ferredoxin oxidoreductase beta subunit
MGLEYVRISPGFERYMPKDYVDLVRYGQFGRQVDVQQLGQFKELVEEQPNVCGLFYGILH